MRKSIQNKGFTLLEILLVIGAIGILAAIVLVAINPNRQLEAARNAKRRSDINTIQKAIQQYSIDNNGQYPAGIETGAKAICRGGTPVGCIDLSILAPTYIASIPEPDSNYYYVRRSNNNIEVRHPRDEIWNIGGTPSLDLNFAKNKSLIDSVSGNNLVTFTRASTATYVGEDGLIKTAAVNEPRFDHNPTTGESLGLLVEEQRTNSIRNNTMVGAVAGTPGTLPTNWSQGNNTGLLANVTGIGVENGISYIEVRVNGTSTGTGQTNIVPETSTSVAAASGQTWTFSSYMKLQSGTLNNVSSINLVLQENTSTGVAVAAGPSTTSIPVSTLGSYRPVYTRTLSGGGTVDSLMPYFQININSGLSVDFTLRIGMPQLEQGAFATSVIPTSGSAVTRQADNANITGTNFSSWYNQSESSVFSESSSIMPSGIIGVFSFNSNGSSNNRFDNRLSNQLLVSSGGNLSANLLIGPGYTANSIYKKASSIKSDDFANTTNGTNVGIDNSGVMPVGINQVEIGNVESGIGKINGTIRRLTYWPTRISNANLQKLTQ